MATLYVPANQDTCSPPVSRRHHLARHADTTLLSLSTALTSSTHPSDLRAVAWLPSSWRPLWAYSETLWPRGRISSGMYHIYPLLMPNRPNANCRIIAWPSNLLRTLLEQRHPLPLLQSQFRP